MHELFFFGVLGLLHLASIMSLDCPCGGNPEKRFKISMEVLKNMKDDSTFISAACNWRTLTASILQNMYALEGDHEKLLQFSSFIRGRYGCACIQWLLLQNSLLKREAKAGLAKGSVGNFKDVEEVNQ